MKNKLRTLLITTLLVALLAGTAPADLAKRINGIIAQKSQSKVKFSIHVIEARSGKTVYSRNAAKPLVPASNMKIIVTAAALKYLGPDYRYKTRVGLCGDTLAIIGAGDPLLGDSVTDAGKGRSPGWIFDDIAAKLKAKGIMTIKDIVVDSTVFDDQRVHPNWPKEQLNKWYACEVSGLNYNNNCIKLSAKNMGHRVRLSVEPKTDFVKLINRVKPVKNGKSGVGAYRNSESNKLLIKGRCKKQESAFVAIERPSAFFGFLMAENLGRAGIKTKGRLLEKAVGPDCDFKKLVEYNTTMKDCLKRCNKNSLGLVAESLLKTIAANSNGGKNGSWAGGSKVLSQYLLRLGVAQNEFYIDDASGLSRKNQLSANALTKVLLNLYKSRNWDIYKESLAVGGVDGTIRKHFGESKYKGKIRGKTGYLFGVRSFSGVCTGSRGDYIFSIIANNANAHTLKVRNDIVKAIVDN
jgi:D-alanyl-D-alanine carboxypeptidase/D-alanyl-D-alanine-endopeptidase (penicillin-binding protein 4)